MYGAQRLAVALENAEPLGTIRCVGGFVDTSCDLFFDDATDLVVEASGNGDVALDPRDMRYDGHNDRGKEVSSEATSLVVVPGDSSVVGHHEVM